MLNYALMSAMLTKCVSCKDPVSTYFNFFYLHGFDYDSRTPITHKYVIMVHSLLTRDSSLVGSAL